MGRKSRATLLPIWLLYLETKDDSLVLVQHAEPGEESCTKVHRVRKARHKPCNLGSMTVEQNFLLWDNHVSAACHVLSLLTFYSPSLTHSLFVLSRASQRTGAHTPVSLLMMLNWAAGSCRIPASRPQTDKSPIMLQICMD